MIGEMLTTNTSLTELVLRSDETNVLLTKDSTMLNVVPFLGNPIGAHSNNGILKLSKALMMNTTLTSLDLHSDECKQNKSS